MITKEQGMAMYLAGSFYPPLPLDYVKPAIEAKELCENEEWDVEIVLPHAINPMPRLAYWRDGPPRWVIKAGDLVNALRIPIYSSEDEEDEAMV